VTRYFTKRKRKIKGTPEPATQYTGQGQRQQSKVSDTIFYKRGVYWYILGDLLVSFSNWIGFFIWQLQGRGFEKRNEINGLKFTGIKSTIF
jgi:hypothetical protein